MKKFFLILQILLISFLCIVAADAKDKKQDITTPILWDVDMNTGVSLKKGNENSADYSLGAQAQKDTNSTLSTLGIIYNYGEVKDEKTSEKFRLYQEFEQKFDKKGSLYWTINTSAEHDFSSGIDHRVDIDPGIGVYLVKDANMTFSVDGGASYEVTKYINEELTDGIKYRGRQRFEYSIFKNVSINESIKYYSDVDNLSNYRIEGVLDIMTYVTENIYLLNKLEDVYENEPLDTYKYNNLSLYFGVGYRW